jgi:hypothetical protein
MVEIGPERMEKGRKRCANIKQTRNKNGRKERKVKKRSR